MVLKTMPATVRLKDIIDALDVHIEESSNYLDLDSGEVTNVSRELLRKAEETPDDEEPDIPEWQKPQWEVAKGIFSSRFLRLPDRFDVNEWEIMQDFASSMKPGRIRDELLNAIHGRGAFRMFKDAVRRHRIEPAWFEFRAEALKQIAIDWCEENHIPWR
jgi:hypothetical protein